MKERNILEEQFLKEIAERNEAWAKEQKKREEREAEEWHKENDFNGFN